MATPSPGRSPRTDDHDHSGDDRGNEQGGTGWNSSSAPEGQRGGGAAGDGAWASRPANPPPPPDGQRPVVFINNLSIQTENRDLEEIYRKFGNLKKVAIMYDPHTRESRGFAFVDYETVEEAQNAVNNSVNIVLHGREIRAELARRGRPRTPTPGRYCGLPKRAPRGPPPGRSDPYSRDPYRARSPDYRDSYRRRDMSPPRSRGDRYGGYGRDRDMRDPYSSRGYDRHSPPPSGYDRRSPPRSSRYDRY